MGFLRSVARSLIGAVFALSLVSLLIVQNMVSLTSYDSMKSLVSQIVTQFAPQELKTINVTQDQLSQARSMLQDYCIGRDTIDLGNLSAQFGVSVQNLPLNITQIKCSSIDKVIPQNVSSFSTAGLVSGFVFDALYYKNYSCDFIRCIMNAKSPTDYGVIISSTFHDFLSSMTVYLVIATVASLAIFVLLIDTWSKRIRSVGWSLLSIGIVTALFPFILKPVEGLVLANLPLPAGAQDILSNTVKPILDTMFNNFTIILAAGIVLLAAGYGLDYMTKRKGKPEKKVAAEKKD